MTTSKALIDQNIMLFLFMEATSWLVKPEYSGSMCPSKVGGFKYNYFVLSNMGNYITFAQI